MINFSLENATFTSRFMSGFRDKITPFVFGLSIGLLAACLFFIFKLDTYIRKIDLSALTQKNRITEQAVAQPQTKEKTPAAKPEQHIRKVELVSDAAAAEANQPAGTYDSSATRQDDYRVLKEELQSVKNIYVRDLAPKERTKMRDSLLASMAGVTLPDDKEFFMVEFWKTPLNSKGYRMTRGRLLIYGFNEGQDLELVKENDKYYLRNNNAIYTLMFSSEFKPMERASENATSKFN